MDDFLVVPVEHEGEFLWCVFEKATEQVVNSFYFEEEANDYAKFLANGGAFAGFTPSFILNEFETNRNPDINTGFESIY